MATATNSLLEPSDRQTLNLFPTQIKVVAAILALATVSPVATYTRDFGPPLAILSNDQIAIVGATASLAWFALLSSAHRGQTLRRISGYATGLTLAAYLCLRSEFVVVLPEVNNSAVVVGYRYTPLAERVRAKHPGTSDEKLLREWFACEVADCFDPDSTRLMNQTLLVSWVLFWLSFSTLAWAMTSPRPRVTSVEPKPEEGAASTDGGWRT